MEGPPTRRTYSPPAGGAARRPIATIDKQQTSNRRFIICREEEYLCRPRNSQVAGHRCRPRGNRSRPAVASSKQNERSWSAVSKHVYHFGSISFRTRSSHV